MIHRGIHFKIHEWTASNGKVVSAYKCNDKYLLKDSSTISFGTSTLQEMITRIDYILNNAEELAIRKELNERACETFYNK